MQPLLIPSCLMFKRLSLRVDVYVETPIISFHKLIKRIYHYTQPIPAHWANDQHIPASKGLREVGLRRISSAVLHVTVLTAVCPTRADAVHTVNITDHILNIYTARPHTTVRVRERKLARHMTERSTRCHTDGREGAWPKLHLGTFKCIKENPKSAAWITQGVPPLEENTSDDKYTS